MEEAVRLRRDMDTDPKAKPALRELRPVEIIELEKRLTDHLSSAVKITYKNEKGKLEVRFGSIEELERLYREFSRLSKSPGRGRTEEVDQTVHDPISRPTRPVSV